MPRAQGLYPLRIAVGLGDAEREQALLPMLTSSGELVVTTRCLSADHLLEAAHDSQTDAVLVADDLHRLSQTILMELTRARALLVLLASSPDDSRWATVPGKVLPLDAGADAVREALTALAHGGGQQRDEAWSKQGHVNGAAIELDQRSAGAMVIRNAGRAADEPMIIAVGGGPASPGRTMVAITLAAALAVEAPTVLVDADLSHPSVAAWLDADVTRNVALLARNEPATEQDWERAIERELQRLDPLARHGAVLCGVPKPELRSAVSGAFFARLLGELRQRFRYVIVDVGSELPGAEGAVQRTALALAEHVLLVVSADLLGLHGARNTLGRWQEQAGISREQLALVINKHDPRFHYGRAEIEWSLRLPAAAVVPYDYRAVQRALAAQRPLLAERSSRAATAILELASRLRVDQITLPPDAAPRRRNWLSRWRRRGAAPAPLPQDALPAVKGAANDAPPLPAHERASRHYRSRGGARAPRGGASGRP